MWKHRVNFYHQKENHTYGSHKNDPYQFLYGKVNVMLNICIHAYDMASNTFEMD